MPRYAAAYSSLIKRLVEVSILERGARKLEKLDPVAKRAEINALCRGAVVLLSGHLEGYVKELGEIAVDALYTKQIARAKIGDNFFYHLSKDTFKIIKATEDQSKLASAIFNFLSTDATYWSKSGPFSLSIPADRFNKGFSNPTVDKIKTYLGRFGYDNYLRELGKNLGAKYVPTVNSINHLVDVRNQIAHGDPSAAKTPGEVSDLREAVALFGVNTDKIFGDWFKVQFCSIR